MAVRTPLHGDGHGEQLAYTSTSELVGHVCAVVWQSRRRSSTDVICFGARGARSDRAVGRSALDASFLPGPEVLAQKEFLKLAS